MNWFQECPTNVKKEMLTKRFCLVDSPESLEEIGQSMNLTTERVKQIRERAIKKLLALKGK